MLNWLNGRSRTLTASKSQVEGFAGGFYSPDRRLAVSSGVFSLVGTLVGGGTLSVPWAVSQCGVGLGLFLLCFFGAISALAVTFLLSAARRCGGLRTYDAVLERMWGPSGRLVAIVSVLVTCFLSLVAIQILLRQLAAPLCAQLLLGRALTDHEAIALGSGLVLAIVPLTFLETLNSLRHVSVLTTTHASVFITVIYRFTPLHTVTGERPLRRRDRRARPHPRLQGLLLRPATQPAAAAPRPAGPGAVT